MPLLVLITAGIVMSSCRKNTMLVNTDSVKSGTNITSMTGSIQDQKGTEITDASLKVLIYRSSPSMPFMTTDPESEGILVVPSFSFTSGKEQKKTTSDHKAFALRSYFKTKAGDQIQSLVFKVVEGSHNAINFADHSTIAMNVRTESGISVTKLFETKSTGKTIDLEVIDLTGAQVSVSGVVSIQSIPVFNAHVKLEWPDGFIHTTTNEIGVYEASVPTYQSVKLTLSDEHHTQTRQFVTSSSDAYAIGVTDLTPTTDENSSLVVTREGIIFLKNDFVAYLQI